MASHDGKTPILYALGSNGSGQLGIGHDQDVSIPRQVLFRPEASSVVVKVAAGGNHTLLLTADGKLYWAGDASTGAGGPLTQGQKDLLAAKKVFVAQEVTLPKDDDDLNATRPVKFAAATWEASIIVQSDSRARDTIVSTFGAGAKGELGQGEFIIRTPAVSRINDFPPAATEVVDLAACMGHVVVVLSNGEAWGWGNGRKGQLGTGVDGVVNTPQRLEGVGFDVARVVCGREFTCLFAKGHEGKVRVLGADKNGLRSTAPGQVAGWRDVGASWGGVYVLKGDGTLLSWGRDDHGQLAPEGLPELAKMAVGSEHAVALAIDGDVLSWGWGEHGNCGPQMENGDVKGRWNTIASKKYIPLGSEITAVGAGCATSWINIVMASQP